MDALEHRTQTNISQEKLVNLFLGIIIKHYRIKSIHTGKPLKLSKSRVSRLMNRKDEIPKRVSAFCREDSVREVIGGAMPGISLQLFDDDDRPLVGADLKSLLRTAPNVSEEEKAAIPEGTDFDAFLSECLLLSLRKPNKTSDSKEQIMKYPGGTMHLFHENLFRIAIGNKVTQRKRIVVIPVDSDFTMAVEDAGVKNPRVSPSSLHGQFILRMDRRERYPEVLKKEAMDYLEKSGIQRGDGGYSIGTVAVVTYGNTFFFLLAISRFDEFNNAQCSKDDIQRAVKALVDFIIHNGQGYPVYVPLIGTGLSNALTPAQSMALIKKSFQAKSKSIRSDIYIVVKDKKEDRKNV